MISILTAAAVAGDACPTHRDLENKIQSISGNARRKVSLHGLVPELARTGLIKIEVYGRNWRVIEIKQGPHAGARTMAPSHGGKPYKIIDIDCKTT